MLMSVREMLAEAVHTGRGVPAFNVIHLEHAEALVAGAERAESPVILQISQNTTTFHGALAPIALATLEIARQSSAPTAVHLDHATDPALVRQAVQLGFNSVMFDGSALEYSHNVAMTAEVAAFCGEHGVGVEAELGEVGGKDGVHAPGARTDPAEAAQFVADTGVGSLAVAVGTSHAMTTRTARVDTELIAALRKTVPVPLVLHGSSGLPDEQLVAAIEAGMTKINIATHLNNAFTTAVRAFLAEHPEVVDTRKYVGAGRAAVRDEVTRLSTLLRRRERATL